MSYWFEICKGCAKATASILSLLLISACNGENKGKFPGQTVSCPSEVSLTTKLPKGTIIFGVLTQSEKPIFDAGLVTGIPSDSLEPIFVEETADVWEDDPDAETATSQYPPGKHNGMSLRCDYRPKGNSEKGYQKPNARVTLLMPLPDAAGIVCVFMRSEKHPKSSASCTAKDPAAE